MMQIHKQERFLKVKKKPDTWTTIISVVSSEAPPRGPPPFQGRWGSGRVKRSTQCYSDLGCFSNEYPFNNSDNALPLNPKFIRTRFLLFTTTNARFPKQIRRDSPELLQRSRYDGSKPTKIIIHGFEQYGMVPWTKIMAKQLILKVCVYFERYVTYGIRWFPTNLLSIENS